MIIFIPYLPAGTSQPGRSSVTRGGSFPGFRRPAFWPSGHWSEPPRSGAAPGRPRPARAFPELRRSAPGFRKPDLGSSRTQSAPRYPEPSGATGTEDAIILLSPNG